MDNLFVGHRGDWHTQGSAVSINRRSGVAVAVHTGTSVLKYNVSMDTVTQTDVSPHVTVLLVLLITSAQTDVSPHVTVLLVLLITSVIPPLL